MVATETDTPVFELRAGAFEEIAGWIRTDLVVGGSPVWMADDVAIDDARVSSAVRTNDGSDRPAVLVELDEKGAAALAELTAAQMSRPIVVVIEGRPSSAPVVMGPLGARFMITADDLTDETCDRLVRRLSSN